jgi:hypothetical protein
VISTDPRLRNTQFAFRFYGWIHIPAGGAWTFFTTSDDGSTLHVNGQLVVNNNFTQAMTERSGTVALAAGYHAVMVSHAQGFGQFGLEARYQGPGVSKRLIPAEALWHTPTGVLSEHMLENRLHIVAVRSTVDGVPSLLGETSADLINWETGEPAVTAVSTRALGHYEVVTFRRNLPVTPENPRAFLRARQP